MVWTQASKGAAGLQAAGGHPVLANREVGKSHPFGSRAALLISWNQTRTGTRTWRGGTGSPQAVSVVFGDTVSKMF